MQYKLLTGERANEAFVKNNQTLRDKVASGAFPDVVLAQWYPHTRATAAGSRDGIHLTLDGALGVADYIARWVAHTEGLPCAKPTVPGGAVEAVCSNPDTQPPIADVTAQRLAAAVQQIDAPRVAWRPRGYVRTPLSAS